MSDLHDALGDSMKEFELVESGRRIMKGLPVLARIDGRTFHSFTRGMERPYDLRFMELMIETTRWIVEETRARIGYTQSDEISLLWYRDAVGGEIFFDGRVQKMTSQLAALASCYFQSHLGDYGLAVYANRFPTFDARVWGMPNLDEVARYFLWRELDATRNSLSMAAHAYYPHGVLLGKKSADQHELLFQKGVNWNDFIPAFKRGTFAFRRIERRKFSAEELSELPPKHHARQNPDLEVERSVYETRSLPPLGKVLNPVGVLVYGQEPNLAL